MSETRFIGKGKLLAALRNHGINITMGRMLSQMTQRGYLIGKGSMSGSPSELCLVSGLMAEVETESENQPQTDFVLTKHGMEYFTAAIRLWEKEAHRHENH